MIVVLVEPSLPENVGGVARVMANFGAAELRLVCPGQPPDNARAVAVAAGGGAVLAAARSFATLDEALADVGMAFAATAVARPTPKAVLPPREFGTRAAADGGAALVLGPERTGLSTEHLDHCSAIVTIPTHAVARSLNLAQAAGILLWSWREALDAPAAAVPAAAPLVDQNALVDALAAQALARGWLSDPRRRVTALRNLRAAWLRAGFTAAELRSLRGLLGVGR